jgi:hypothetical protein
MITDHGLHQRLPSSQIDLVRVVQLVSYVLPTLREDAVPNSSLRDIKCTSSFRALQALVYYRIIAFPAHKNRDSLAFRFWALHLPLNVTQLLY